MEQLKETKKCPRCGVKVPVMQEKCPNCRLIYERLRLTTNKSARLALRKGLKNKVIDYNVLPPDLSRLRLLLYCLFFGYLGVHRFYVGKIKSAFFFLITFIALFIANIIFFFSIEPLYDLAYFMIMPISFNVLFWVMDFFRILFKKFKVPVSIPEDFAVEGEYGGVLDLMRDIDNSIKKGKRKKLAVQARQEGNTVEGGLLEGTGADEEQQTEENVSEAETGAFVLQQTEDLEKPKKNIAVFDPRTINRGSGSKKKKHKKGRK